MVPKRFWSSLHAGTTRTYPGAIIGSDHDKVTLNFNLKLKKVIKHSHIKKKFNVDKLKNLTTGNAFQVTVGGKFATLLDKNCDLEVMTNEFSSILTEMAEVFGIQ